MTSAWMLPAAGLAVIAPIMGMAWSRQRRTGNAGIVDVLWAGTLGALALGYAALTEGWWPRTALVALLAGLWSVRLTVLLARRVASEAEDGRYAILRRTWGERFQPRLFWFFQAQGLLAVLLSLAFLVPMQASEPGWRPQDAAAVLLWLVSMVGETISDRQLHAWRSDPSRRGLTCRRGLWAYSRHPNYFFEWLHWLTYPVLAFGLPFGWTLWLAPALMLFLILRVTGIPPTEEQAVRSRGDDYRDYQRTTNAFFPGPRRAPREATELS